METYNINLANQAEAAQGSFSYSPAPVAANATVEKKYDEREEVRSLNIEKDNHHYFTVSFGHSSIDDHDYFYISTHVIANIAIPSTLSNRDRLMEYIFLAKEIIPDFMPREEQDETGAEWFENPGQQIFSRFAERGIKMSFDPLYRSDEFIWCRCRISKRGGFRFRLQKTLENMILIRDVYHVEDRSFNYQPEADEAEAQFKKQGL